MAEEDKCAGEMPDTLSKPLKGSNKEDQTLNGCNKLVKIDNVLQHSHPAISGSSTGDCYENVSLYDKHDTNAIESVDIVEEATLNEQQQQQSTSGEETFQNNEESSTQTPIVVTPLSSDTRPPLNNNTRQTRNDPPQVDLGQRLHRLNIRDRHGVFMNYLFLNLTIRYIIYFKATTRRLIEFFSLLNALLMFFLLFYIHVTFVRSSGNCLNHVKDIWPQSGILRVQISYNVSDPSYRLLFVKNDIPASVTFQSTPYNAVFKFSSPISSKDIVNYRLWRNAVMNDSKDEANHSVCHSQNLLDQYRNLHLLKGKCPLLEKDYIQELKLSFSTVIASLLSEMTVEYQNSKELTELLDEASRTVLSSPQSFFANFFEYDPLEPPVVRDFYAIEYSTEFGYLRLSTKARYKLGIPTLIVNLNPDVDQCFGNGLKKFMLKTFLGYDDFLMSSIKQVAEGGKSQGYLRNCVTGDYFRFVTIWVSHSSGFVAFAVMIVFTLIVSMLLRYSYHQIFMFMMEVLRIFDTDIRLVFPAAPMLTIVLALVGMEEIMTEFFHDSTVAFYVILLIWCADQFDVICLHTVVGRRHWVRFFYLYHFAFYVYNYKFNGQYSKLALFTSWLFIFHSMIYFYHHYEIPAIQRQMVLIAQRNRGTDRQNSHEPDNASEPHQSSNDIDVEAAEEQSVPTSSNPNNENSSDSRRMSSSPGVVSFANNRLRFFQCYFHFSNNIYLPYICSFFLLLVAVALAAIIYSKLSWVNHTLEIIPFAFV